MVSYSYMSHPEIAKTYDPKLWEEKLYTEWEKSGFFNPDTCANPHAKPFSIVLPPPNVTGTLHAGHASMLAIEDAIVRYHRMKGDRTLWLPGTDHAAIATQSKVEKILKEKEGETRYDLGREEFLRRVEQFAKESHDTIVNQCKKMGSSLDWSREAYTLDAKRNLAVRTAFKKMYDDGIIYRGKRIVNWDPVGQTTISDDEIVYREESAKLYYLKYGPFEIATARPETKFGDKYVVMHPDDPRYAAYQDGQKLTLEWINGSIEATVIKDASIDMEFGTGVMTITPWHSMVDFELAERHQLDMEPIIDLSGKLLPVAGEFAGLHISEAREKIIEKLEKKGLVTKIEDPYIHQIATAERTGATIEPQIMQQWFIGVNREFERNGKKVTLKTLMQDAVRSSDVTILPERFNKIYFHWIDNLRDWCISRQIWFGHRIPVWYRGDETSCEIDAPRGDGWTQDPDTLDTWFSSGLWTFSTLGWPNTQDPDFKTFHPTNLLETGYDILFFWVARMILMSEYLLGVHPFDTVYLHGLVRDAEGRKMSKSLGNIINPLDAIEKYGADALRLAFVSGSTPGNDTSLSDEKILAMRNFTNKLWNLARYVGTTTEHIQDNSRELKAITDADKDLLQKLHTIIRDTTRHLDRYELSLATEKLRDFTWSDFADWYVEVHKIEKNDALLRFAFDTLLKLWHPFMPFVTEAIHQTFHFDQSKFLMMSPWPTFPDTQEEIADANRFELVKSLIVALRNTRALYHIDPAEFMTVSAFGGSEQTIRDNEAVFKRLARIETIQTLETSAAPENSILVQAGLLQVFLHLDGVIDIEKEKQRLTKEQTDLESYISRLTKRLADSKFTSRAPKAIVAKEEASLQDAQTRLRTLQEALSILR